MNLFATDPIRTNYRPIADLCVATRKSALNGEVVHVWTVPIGASSDATPFLQFLSQEEQRRAARFRARHLQHAFILTRGTLRLLLGSYLDIDPTTFVFSYGPNGKPSLILSPPLNFNVSHSEGLAAIALTTNGDIGIDVERIRPIPNMGDISNHFFCREEAAELMSVPVGERQRSFLACWTRKEAYLKAVGHGLSAPLDSFRVTLRPGEPARFVSFAGDVNAAKSWMLHDLELGSEYAGALAYQGEPRSVSLFAKRTSRLGHSINSKERRLQIHTLRDHTAMSSMEGITLREYNVPSQEL